MLEPAEDKKRGRQRIVTWTRPKLERNEEIGGVIPVCEPTLLGNESAYVRECLDTNWISSKGLFLERFEKAFAKACGVAHGVCCSNGTAAIHLALHTMGIGPGDEVIIPTFSIIASANAVRLTGATPVFVDCEPDRWTLDPSRVETKITLRTRAIMPVHIYGMPCRMDPILRIAKKHDLWVLEDAAEAFSARYANRKVGSFGDAAIFSLYANKIITSGEGGVVVTDQDELANLLKSCRDQAISDQVDFWHRMVGFNYRMTNLQAAIGLGQLENAEELTERRVRNADRYDAGLKGIPGIQLPPRDHDAKNVFWMYAILVGPEFGMNRDRLMIELGKRGIETRTFFIPLHLQPIYYDGQDAGEFPVAEDIAQRGMYLPSSGRLTSVQIDYIVETIRKLQKRTTGMVGS